MTHDDREKTESTKLNLFSETWKQHRNEITDLQFILRGTQEKLQHQSQAYKEQVCKFVIRFEIIINDYNLFFLQAERLARADMLAKDLYLENAYLIASVERLEQHCHALTQYGTESTSV